MTDTQTQAQKQTDDAIKYALDLIRAHTGHGVIIIKIKDGTVEVVKAEHEIRPKYLPPPAREI